MSVPKSGASSDECSSCGDRRMRHPQDGPCRLCGICDGFRLHKDAESQLAEMQVQLEALRSLADQ
jgi:hypothetical protein